MENNRDAGPGRKFLEGIIVSAAIMVMFMLLQIMVSSDAGIYDTWWQ